MSKPISFLRTIPSKEDREKARERVEVQEKIFEFQNCAKEIGRLVADSGLSDEDFVFFGLDEICFATKRALLHKAKMTKIEKKKEEEQAEKKQKEKEEEARRLQTQAMQAQARAQEDLAKILHAMSVSGSFRGGSNASVVEEFVQDQEENNANPKYDDLSFNQLKKIASQKGHKVIGVAGMTRDKILELLKNVDDLDDH